MRKSHLVLAMAVATVACAPADETANTGPIDLADVGFQTPESVLHDAQGDVYLVSNINGNPLAKDDNGFISRVAPDGELLALTWIDGTSDEVELHAPKGMAIIADTLFVTDIDVIRLFERESGAPLGTRRVEGATFLNDLAAGPDGTLYATDSGLRAGADGFEDAGTDAVYRFENGSAVALVTGPDLGRPNGIVADETSVTVVTFGSGTIYEIDVLSGDRSDLPIPEQGQLDGVVRLENGNLILSSWAASALYRLGEDGTFSVAIDSVPAPADIGYDAGRNRVLIPLFTENRVLIRDIR